jgi:hypothetical protein
MGLRVHVSRVSSPAMGARRARAGPAPPWADLHSCPACGAPTIAAAFCHECLDRARPHRDDDPYDDLGGEGEAM